MVKASPARDLVNKTISLNKAQGRDDLDRRLGHTQRRLDDPSVRVLVVGEFKQGKSQLINALVGASVCPLDDDIATAVPTEVGYAQQPSAHVFLAPDGRADVDPADTETREVPIGDLTAYILRTKTLVEGRRIVGARALLPRQLLQSGLTLVDTPGVGGLDSMHSAATMTVLPSADAVIMVSDASAEFTAPEIEFLRKALAACPTVFCVLSKTDLYPQWRRILELNTAHLRNAGLDIPIIPVSAQVRLQAMARQDVELNTLSGYPELVNRLQQQVIRGRERLLMQSTSHDVNAVLANIRMGLETERSALTDPEALPEITAGLVEARTRAEELKKQTSRWQVTLSDGLADLNADLDHDLRDRIRRVLREAERAIDDGDPGESWDIFSAWYSERINSALADTFAWADDNAAWLVDQVGVHFVEETQSLSPVFHLDDTQGLIETVGVVGDLDRGHLNPIQRVLIGMRGSYGGILMFGLMTGLAGMALVNPISVGAGLLLGTKAYREDAQQRLKRRRSEAKGLVRKYADDVIFYVAKQLRDRLRLVQRTVREYYTDVADELAQSMTKSLATAKEAAQATAAERKERLAVVEQTLRTIAALERDSRALTSTGGKPSPQPGAQRPKPSPQNSAPAPSRQERQDTPAPSRQDAPAGSRQGSA